MKSIGFARIITFLFPLFFYFTLFYSQTQKTTIILVESRWPFLVFRFSATENAVFKKRKKFNKCVYLFRI